MQRKTKRKLSRTWHRRLGLLLGALVFGATNSIAYGADTTSFETKEYFGSNGLAIINAAQAYQRGYTGKGITLGVCDEYTFFLHPEFRSKLNSYTTLPVPSDYNWAGQTHGTHVGGIMVAAKDGKEMHGVAFDADLVSGMFFPDYAKKQLSIQSAYDAFNSNKQIKIINNSWSQAYYIDQIGKGKEGVLQEIELSAAEIKKSIVEHDKVIVFAVANEGQPTPRGETLLPYLIPETAPNFISVMSIDPARYNIETKTADSGFMTIVSNATKYAEENSVAAPGHDIYSAISTSPFYLKETGSSMAAPFVSATAGLVQQAFPYMNGRQIVDTVLSSANRSFTLPKFTLTIQASVGKPLQLNVYYFGDKPTDPEEIRNDLKKYYKENEKTVQYFSSNPSDPSKPPVFSTDEEFANATRNVYGNVPLELVFGQGLLDAGAAVRGPGLLNARRMDTSNISSAYGPNQALYKVDTQGYDSVWSNNIGQIKAGKLAGSNTENDLIKIYNYYKQSDEIITEESKKGKTDEEKELIPDFTQGQEYINAYNARYESGGKAEGLIGLDVGLYKSGEGILILSGNNEYKGTSIAAGGVLQIDGSVAGDAWSQKPGIIAGTGMIGANLYNQSIVQAGSYDITKLSRPFSPGTLSVGGELKSTGAIAVAANGASAYSKLKVEKSATVSDTTFMAVPGSVYQVPVSAGDPTPYTEVITVPQDPQYNITGTLSPDYSAFTGMLSAKGKINDDSKSLSLHLVRANNLGAMTGRQQQTYTLMDSLFTGQSGMYPLYSLDADKAKQALTAIYGGAQLNQAAAVQRDTLIGTAIAARMDYVNQPVGQNMTFLLPGFAPGTFGANAIIPLEVGSQNSWWMKAIKNWGSNDAQQDLPGIDNRSYGLVVGQDRKVDDHWRLGYLMGYGQNRVTSTLAATDSHGYRLGVYGGYSKGVLDLHTYLDYGRHSNHADRYIRTLSLQSDSNYDSNTLSFGIGARYNLHAKKDKLWQVSPYADLYISRYNQDGYREKGAGNTYDQIADPLANTFSTGEIGLEMARTIPNGRYAFHMGYKKVLSGSNPEMTIAYTIKPTNKITISGNEQDREYLVLGLSIQGQLAKNLTIDSQINHQQGANSRSLTAAVTLRKVW